MPNAKSSAPGLASRLTGGIIGIAVLLTTAAGLYLALTMLNIVQPITIVH